jgi:hypothetical protein
MAKDQKKPQAFPYSGEGDDMNTSAGMTLRDYFAAKALQGIISANGDSSGYLEYEEEVVAKNAYKLADAMLKARAS